MISAILFDLDGTLIDSAPVIANALNQVIAKRRGAPVAVSKVRRLVSRGAPELVAACLASCASTPERDLADFRSAYGAIAPDVAQLYPGAQAVLTALAADGIRLGLCTNKPQTLTESILRALDLASLFSVVLGGDAIARPKPHPDHLLAATAALSVRPSETVYVGDSEIDAESAQRAGISFIFASYGYALDDPGKVPHHGRLDRLDQLSAILSKITPRRGT